MNEKMVVSVSQEWVDKIQALQFEVTARKDIISYMLSNGHDMNSEGYKKYYAEYMEFFKEYDKVKDEFAREYVLPYTNNKLVDWNLDFVEKEVTFHK